MCTSLGWKPRAAYFPSLGKTIPNFFQTPEIVHVFSPPGNTKRTGHERRFFTGLTGRTGSRPGLSLSLMEAGQTRYRSGATLRRMMKQQESECEK
jgi:hypothetical protein